MLQSAVIRNLQKVLLTPGVDVILTVSHPNVLRLFSTANYARMSFPAANANPTTTVHQLPAFISHPVRCLSRTGFESKSGSGSQSRQQPWMSLAFLPAAFFGLWKTEEDEMSVEDKILMDIKRAILSIKRDQIDKAEKYLARALSKSQEEKLEAAISQILDLQANLALQNGELDKAEHLLKVTAQRLISLQGFARNDNAIIEMSIKLAQIYEKTGHLDKAMSGYEYCIQAQQDKIKKNEVEDDEAIRIDTLLLLAWSCHSLGQLHMKIAVAPDVETGARNNHVQVATTLSTDAYRYATEAEGPESQHAVTIKSDLATIKALTGDLDGALQMLEEVEIIAKEKHTDLYPHISVNVGNLHLQKGSYEEAKRICQEAKLSAGKINDMEAFARAQECIIKCGKLLQDNKK